ncbi:hypothetical protein ARMGADRAFT_1077529 [Armillaria gallica]|uniref:Uncharacterized protein n=1 Tax=Armillaria gallica TaxID=47427 RepID=A0A2H3DLC9_ARMGA|nr:hypothetical protein ARMGADRAFT_1077529 [Armillaria gallica]
MSSSLRQPPAATTELASENDGIAPVGLAFQALVQENQDLVHCLDKLECTFNDLRHRGEIAERAHQ